jgi:hypothetical protein
VLAVFAALFLGLSLLAHATLLAGNALSAWRISRILNSWKAFELAPVRNASGHDQRLRESTKRIGILLPDCSFSPAIRTVAGRDLEIA